MGNTTMGLLRVAGRGYQGTFNVRPLQLSTDAISEWAMRVQDDPILGGIVIGGILSAALLVVLLLEVIAAYRGWRALRSVENQRESTLDALRTLATTADDVIMMSSGSRAKVLMMVERLGAAETRAELQRGVNEGLSAIRALPFDKKVYQSLDGSWVLQEHRELAERELTRLDEQVRRHESATALVSFHRFNLVARLIHGILYAVYTPRWLAGRLGQARDVGEFAISSDEDRENKDRVRNVHSSGGPATKEGSSVDAAGGEHPEESETTVATGSRPHSHRDAESFLEDVEWMSPEAEDDGTEES